MDDGDINDNTYDDTTAIDDEEIVDEIRSLPSTAKEQPFLRSGLRPRNRTPNSHRDSYSKEFIGSHTRVKREGVHRERTRKEKRNKPN